MCRSREHPAKKDAKGVKYTYHAHHKLETLDTSNAEQVNKFVDSFKKGEIEGSIEEKKEVNILALKWDLGLWALVVFLLPPVVYVLVKTYARILRGEPFAWPEIPVAGIKLVLLAGFLFAMLRNTLHPAL